MYLKKITNVVPEAAYSQEDCWNILQSTEQFKNLLPQAKRITKKVLTGNSGIAKRHFAMPNIESIFDRGPDDLNQGFEREAPKLAKKALEKALVEADLLPTELDALFICTCTGYLCPGVTSHVAEQLNLSPSIYLQDIVGLGCGAAIPTLRSATHFLKANPTAKVACIAVEVCSSAFFMNNDPGVLISMCLFGDGAAAMILDGEEANSIGAFSQFESLHLPQFREDLRFVLDGGKLRNNLDLTIPKIASEAVHELKLRYAATDIEPICLSHSGGKNVLEAIEEILKIAPIESSREVLNQYGNMSSPSILFALKHRLDCSVPTDRNYWLTAFGAGFTAHSCAFEKF